MPVTRSQTRALKKLEEMEPEVEVKELDHKKGWWWVYDTEQNYYVVSEDESNHKIQINYHFFEWKIHKYDAFFKSQKCFKDLTKDY